MFYRIEAVLGALLAVSACGLALWWNFARLATIGVLALLAASFASILVWTQIEAMRDGGAVGLRPWILLVAFSAYACWRGIKLLRAPDAIEYFVERKGG